MRAIGNTLKLICFAGFGALALSACASMQVPDFNAIDFPDFREEAENIGDYPDPVNAPRAPNDLRSDAAWDAAAKDILQNRNALNDIPARADQGLSGAELERELEALDAKIEAYKLDDPPDMHN